MAFPLFGVLAGTLCVVWGWWPARRWSDQRQNGAVDQEAVFHAAQVRWWSLAVGRALAIALALPPFFMFLKTVDVKEQLDWPGTERAVITQRDNQPPRAWFWTTKGRYLRRSDFQNSLIFGYSRAKVSPELLRIVAKNLAVLESDQASEASHQAYDELLKWLTNHRLRQTKDFEACFATEPETDSDIVFLLQEQTFPDPVNLERRTIFHASHLLKNGILIPRTQDYIETLSNSIAPRVYPLLGVGLLGFLVLWRRGGDLALGRWLGLWLLSVSFWGYSDVSAHYLPATQQGLWYAAMASPSKAAIAGLLVSMYLLVGLLLTLTCCFIPQAAIWVHLCWPSRHREAASMWPGLLATGGKILLVALVINAANIGLASAGLRLFPDMVLHEQQLHYGYSVASLPLLRESWTAGLRLFPCMALYGQRFHYGCSVATLPLLLVLGYVFRRRLSRFSEVPKLGWMPPLAMGLLLVSLVLLFAERAPSSQVFIVAFFLLTAYILVRGNFLRVSPTRDLTVLLAVAVLPLVFEYAKDLSENWLTHKGLFGHRASQILGVLAVLLVIKPLHRAVERFVVMLSAPRLRTIERAVANVLESIVDDRLVTDPREEVARLFREWSVEQYVFYSRLRPGILDIALSRMDAEPPVQLVVSHHLFHHLCKQQGFLDLDSVPFEWRHFFHQFELFRLQHHTRCRYLLPLCLGPSLRGLLLLPEHATEAALRHDSLVSRLSAIGVEVVRM
jgi:hypothetical protein